MRETEREGEGDLSLFGEEGYVLVFSSETNLHDMQILVTFKKKNRERENIWPIVLVQILTFKAACKEC